MKKKKPARSRKKVTAVKSRFFEDIKEGLHEALDYARGKIALRTTEFQSSTGDLSDWKRVGISVEKVRGSQQIATQIEFARGMYEELIEIAAATNVEPGELVVSFLRESIDRHFEAKKVRQDLKREPRMYSDDEIREWTNADQFKDEKERRGVRARLKRNRTSK